MSGRLLAIAWRNLRRNGRRTGVTVAAMTLACLVMILYTSLVEGYLRDLERDIVEVEVGDLQIHAEGYRQRPSIYATIESSEELLRRLEQGGYRASPRLLGGGLAASGDASAGALLQGLDVARDAGVSTVHETVAEGRWLDPADPTGVVVGRRLARILSLEPGAELVVLGQATDGGMANDLYRVRGVLGPVSESVDRAVVFLAEQAFRDLFHLESGVHRIVVRRPPETELESARQEVAALADGLETRSWRQLLPTLASVLDTTRSTMIVAFLILYLAIAILILNAMLMAVYERIRELGVLKAIGLSPGRVFRLVLAEGLLQAVLAIGIALVLSLPGLWYLTQHGVDVGRLGGVSMSGMTMDQVWHGAISARTFLAPTLTLFSIVALAVLFPGLKAARLSPVEAMGHR